MSDKENTITMEKEEYSKCIEEIEELSQHLVKLCAMLQISFGVGDLSIWRKDIQDNYLWACSTMADQASSMADNINLRVLR